MTGTHWLTELWVATAQLQTTTDQLSASLTTLGSQVADDEKTIATLTQGLSNVTDDVKAIQSDVSTLEANVSGLQTNVSSLTTSVGLINSRLGYLPIYDRILQYRNADTSYDYPWQLISAGSTILLGYVTISSSTTGVQCATTQVDWTCTFGTGSVTNYVEPACWAYYAGVFTRAYSRTSLGGDIPVTRHGATFSFYFPDIVYTRIYVGLWNTYNDAYFNAYPSVTSFIRVKQWAA